MSNFDLFSQDYQAAAQQARKKAMDELAVESQKIFPDYSIPQLNNTVTPQQVYDQHLLALRAYRQQTTPTTDFTTLTEQLNTIKRSDPYSRTGDQKLIEELHRLAAENRELKNQLALRTEPTNRTRLSTSWEHLPDVIPTNAVTSRSVPDFPFAALRRGNKQVVGLMTDRPT